MKTQVTCFDKRFRFYEIFNRKTGLYVRSGILKKNAEKMEDSGIDPFMRSFPSLLDIGIMGSCVHGLSGHCKIGCYQSGQIKKQPNMSLEKYCSIMEQCRDRVFQVALGGRGDPNKHEQFEEILKCTVDNGIVPNFTTSGYRITPKEMEITKKYVGAVAVSWYGDYSINAVKEFIKIGCKTNIHFVVSKNSIDKAISILSGETEVPKGLNAIVFLMHKPVGTGSKDLVLDVKDLRTKTFFELASSPHDYKSGFDACSVPGLLKFTSVDRNMIDSCDGSRFSAYISPDMKMMPCSFDQDNRWIIDLETNTIEKAWNSEKFENFRNVLKSSCMGCKDQTVCYGGCPIRKEIVLCEERK